MESVHFCDFCYIKIAKLTYHRWMHKTPERRSTFEAKEYFVYKVFLLPEKIDAHIIITDSQTNNGEG